MPKIPDREAYMAEALVLAHEAAAVGEVPVSEMASDTRVIFGSECTLAMGFTDATMANMQMVFLMVPAGADAAANPAE